MKNRLTYKHTMVCCFMAYITSAIINNFAPLLFLTFQKSYGLTVPQLGVLVTANFFIQMFVDCLGARYAHQIGYRKTIVTALFASAGGLICLGILPELVPNKFAGLLASVAFYAIGSGLIEVMVSPMTEALPTKNKEGVMSLMHSFYCWGVVFVVLVSTLFFVLAGIDKWNILSILWAIIPLATAIAFLVVPIYTLENEDGAKETGIKAMFKNKIFSILVLLMICSGASEIAMAQWVSYFAEEGLRVSKTMGDLLGACLFAVLMGSMRVFYAKYSTKLNLVKVLKYCSLLCVVSYIVASLVPNPAVALAGCALCGITVALMWPGVLSIGAAVMPKATTAMFALLAVGGDIGCGIGPQAVSLGSLAFEINGSSIKAGLLCAIFFPIIMYIALNVLSKITAGQQKNI